MFWAQQSVWSQAADRLKDEIGRARAASLVLGLTGAVLGTAASQTMARHTAWGQALAFGAALVTGLIALTTRYAGPDRVREWTRLRSMSEAIKSEVYVWLAGVAPYRGPDALPALHERVERLREGAADLLPCTAGIEPQERRPPLVTDVPSYVELRVEQQIRDYYLPRSREMGRRLAAVRGAEFALAATAVLLGALSGAFGVEQVAAWVAVATTAATTVSVHGLAAKYAYQETEFAMTADELRRTVERRLVRDRTEPEDDDAFVTHCEQVISILNDTWMVKWTSA
ncbi:DUF4231 domain-containing protein [Streptomyces sp. NPDC055210]